MNNEPHPVPPKCPKNRDPRHHLRQEQSVGRLMFAILRLTIEKRLPQDHRPRTILLAVQRQRLLMSQALPVLLSANGSSRIIHVSTQYPHCPSLRIRWGAAWLDPFDFEMVNSHKQLELSGKEWQKDQLGMEPCDPPYGE
jgi:hypothetical protein